MCRMNDDGRWIRVTGMLREAIEHDTRACTCGVARDAAALQVVALYDRARPEDWIAQLTEINRKLTEENKRLETSLKAGFELRSELA
jgi:hypothetical protein